MWKAAVGGRRLTFRLVGVNNQNFIMQDEQTGSWWQQITGVALHGPLSGARLEPMPFETLSFALWKQEHPSSQVLAAEQRHLDDYAPADWVARLRARMPVPEPLSRDRQLEPRDLVVGLQIDGRAKAYPLAALAAQNPIADDLGGTPVLLVVAGDGASVRIFDRRLDGETLELYLRAGSDPPALIDASSGSEFDFRGLGTSGRHAGRSLRRFGSITEFWFDWRHYHPDTWLYEAGPRS